MLIDWFTVAAQALNFLVLVWLMKRYLYHPVLDAVAARDKSIAAQLAAAAHQQAEALRQRDEFTARNTALEAARRQQLEQAAAEAAAERTRLLAAARREAQQERQRQRDALRREQAALAPELARRTRDEVFSIARQALSDLAGSTLDDAIAGVFAARLAGLDTGARDTLAAALAAGQAPLVRSAAPLAASSQALLRQALAAVFGDGAAPRFDHAPALLGGVELVIGGWRLEWNIAAYLAGLEARVAGTPDADPPAAQQQDGAA